MVSQSPNSKKVGLIIPGAGKCATTTLFTVLKNHPQMCASRIKEPNYFSKKENWRNLLDWYHGLFQPLPGQILFESSPSYARMHISDGGVLEKIYEYNPEMQFIYLVRDPKERIISSYMQTYQRFNTDLDLHRAIREIPRFIETSKYFTFCTAVINIFGRNRLMIVDFDDFIHDRATIMQHIAEFLGIDPNGFQDVDHVHKNPTSANTKHSHIWDEGWRLKIKKVSPRIWRFLANMNRRIFTERPKLSVEDQRMIIGVLSKEIDQLEGLIGKSLQHWKQIRE